MKTNVLNLICLFAILLIAISCEKETPIVQTTGIVFPKTSVLLNVGSQDTLKVAISPTNATNPAVTWTSSDTTVARVNADGIVTGVKHGSSTITATTVDGKYKATCVVQSLKWTRYTTADGLSANSVSCVVIDSVGSLWFGGLSASKFDGSIWTTYLDNQGARAIAVDKQNNKWFGTGYGISKFDGTNWITYDTSNSGLTDSSINSNTVAIDLNASVWAATSSQVTFSGTGVSVFNGTTWKGYNSTNGLASNNVVCIAADAQGNKWFSTYKGLSRFDGTTWTSYTSANTNTDLVNNVECIAFDAQGNKWFGTDIGLLKFDGTTWTTYTISNSGLICNPIVSIAIDKQGNKWLGTLAGGVTKFDGTTWTNYNYDKFIVIVRGIAIDKQGNKWFATDNGVFELQD
jgi:ligand-binding sensor domain-containing protein